MFEELQFEKWNAASAELAQRIIADPECRVINSNAKFYRTEYENGLNEIRFGWPRGQYHKCIGYIQEVKREPGTVMLYLHLDRNAHLIKPAGPFEDASKGRNNSKNRKPHTDDDLGKLRLSASSFSDEVFDWINCAIKNVAAKGGIPLPNNWLAGPSVIELSKSTGEDAIHSAREGKRLLQLHRTIERNRGVVNAKKAVVLSTTGDLKCEICSFSFRDTYGEHGEGFTECHHVKPLAELTDETLTSVADLAIVCANCHRMLHRRPFPSMDYLRQVWKKL